MELKIRLTCYEKVRSDRLFFKWVNGRYRRVMIGAAATKVCDEYSKSFGLYAGMVRTLKLPLDATINNGSFRVVEWWVTYLQPYFTFEIDLDRYDCYIYFEYRDFDKD